MVSLDLLKPPIEEDWKKLAEQADRVQRETEEITAATTAFRNSFDSLELALSELLHAIVDGQKSRVAYAIFYSVNSFEARTYMVENALLEATGENARLALLAEDTHWHYIANKIRKMRDIRNAVAHGTPKIFSIRGKLVARLTTPIFDTIRVGRPLAKGTVPGLGAKDITLGGRPMQRITMCVDAVNRVVCAARAPRDPTLPRRLHELATHLQALHNLYPSAPNEPKPKRRPQPSAASRRKAALQRRAEGRS
jgi:hypothetical protein